MSQITIGLDLSTKTGLSIFKDGKLESYQLVTLTDERKDELKAIGYPFSLIIIAQEVCNKIFEVIHSLPEAPKEIVIEETCASRNVFAQKQIEWIHYEFCHHANIMWPLSKIVYLGSPKWKSILGIKFPKDFSKHNKLVKAGEARGKITNKHLSVWKANDVYNLNFLMKNDNEADAIHLAAAYLEQTGRLKHEYDIPFKSLNDR